MIWHLNQRVRLVRPRQPSKMGATGRIHSFECFNKGDMAMDGIMAVDTDCVILWDGESVPCCQLLSQLEPIVPDGAKPSEFTTVTDLLESFEKVEEKVYA